MGSPRTSARKLYLQYSVDFALRSPLAPRNRSQRVCGGRSIPHKSSWLESVDGTMQNWLNCPQFLVPGQSYQARQPRAGWRRGLAGRILERQKNAYFQQLTDRPATRKKSPGFAPRIEKRKYRELLADALSITLSVYCKDGIPPTETELQAHPLKTPMFYCVFAMFPRDRLARLHVLPDQRKINSLKLNGLA